ncbi:LLM class flavin-dependent oxidoreductase [Arenivirga flava]|uniref:Luciferase-like domain-containing protein n=1 Tax=Arenivirga flava TaxID=1930060 RepID=A0AA37XB60_9MICO|nr:LLM class flavin-dependent oxidoreductase [Arenivirga flava]GMA28378.1 hypothetical protein GCM10025874_16310 [Arenivirga flava]
MARRRRTLHLLLGVPPLGGHRAAWRRAELPAGAQADPSHYAELAGLAEAAKLDAVVLPDAAALAEDPASAPPARLDPSVLLGALATATTRIGLVAATGTSTAHPFEVARRIASLDLVSGGRAALLATSDFPEAAALNVGDDPAALRGERHRRAAEFLHVVQRLWDSWHPSAVVGDTARGLFVDPERIAPIDHDGEFFAVRGPLPVPRGPQGRPPVLVAASSDAERALAARHGEIVLGGEGLLERAVTAYNEVKARAAAIGRSPDRIRVLGRVATVVGATEADARARLRELDAYLRDDGEPLGAAGWAEEGRGGVLLVGAPEQVAEELARRFRAGAADGFVLTPDVFPSGARDLLEQVVPILRQRELFRRDYEGVTLRDHLGLPQPVLRRGASAT